MGWDKRSSRNRYDSISCHVLMNGRESKDITDCVSRKTCLACSKAQQIGEEPLDHIYPKKMRVPPKRLR